jgi:aminopeptidase N
MKSQYYPLLLILFFSFITACKSSKDLENSQNPSLDVAKSFAEQESLRQDYLAKEKKIADYQKSDTRHFDLLHTDISLAFDYENQRVLGEAFLTLKPYFFPQKELVLDAKDFEIHDLIKVQGSKETPLNYHYNGKKLTAYLPTTINAKDTLQIKIRYTAYPNVTDQKGSAAITDTKGLYFINPKGELPNKPIQIWTQGETAHNSKWYPTIDSPNERATQSVKLRVDQKFLTLSNGKKVKSLQHEDGTRTDFWEMDLPHAPYLAAVVVGEFEEIKDQWEDIEVNYYLEKEFAKGGAKVFQNTPEMIGFFSRLLGVRYPWQKYNQVVVRDFVSGAMENTTLSIFMEELNLDERAAIDSEWDGIIAHELFHQWFGNYVTTESWANLTMNEGFANYSEYLWYEYKNGKDEADLHHISEMEQYFEEALTKQEDLVRFYHEDPEDMFDSHSYAKGGRILHMLRRYIGDDAFFASLKYYLEKHAFSSVEVHDLRLAFEKVTGMDLNWFFNQWFLDKGHPELSYTVDYSQPKNLLLTIEQHQDLSQAPLYKIPFKVSWYENEKSIVREFILDKKRQQFAIPHDQPITQLYVDEEKGILAKFDSYRGKDYFVKQFNESQHGVARYEALDSLASFYNDSKEYHEVVKKSLKDSFWAIRELALVHLMSDTIMVADEEIEAYVLVLAEKDPKNTLRSGAIEVLSKIAVDKYASDFRRWSSDSSYYVSGSAIEAYLINENNADREDFARQFEAIKNGRIAVALANYYISENVFGKEDWFHEQLEALTGTSLYYFLGYYGEYFVVDEGRDREQAVDKIYQLGKNHGKNYIRMASFQALFGFIDDERVEEKVLEIYEKEEDKMMKEYMKLYIEGLEMKD